MTDTTTLLRNTLIERILANAPSVTYESLYSVVDCLVSGDASKLVYEEGDCPKDPGEEVWRRATMLYELDSDVERQREEMEAIRDVQYFFDNYWWQPDVKAKRVLPFVLFERQREIVDWLGERYDRQEPGLQKKSREFGLSCLLMGYGCNKFLLESHFNLGVASRKQQYLYERHNWHSILEKFLFGLEHLPPWMRPRAWNRDDHVTRNKIMNPENGSMVMGEVGEFIGSGGRASMYVVDEFSLVERQAEAWQSLAGTADCVICVYTSKGPATFVHQELESNPNIPLMVSPWWWDPRKVDGLENVGNADHWSKWAEEKLANTTEYIFELEFCCNDEVPESDGICSPAWMRASREAEPVPHGLPVAGIDLADGGPDEHVLAIRTGAQVDLFTWQGMELEEVAPKIAAKLTEHNVRVAFYDNSGRGASFGRLATDTGVDCRFIGVNGGADAGLRQLRDSTQSSRLRFANKTTELWWAMSLAIKGAWERENGIEIAPDAWVSIRDKKLEQQIMARKYELQKSGVKLQDKRRMLGSPDRADALAFTYERDPRVSQSTSSSAISPGSGSTRTATRASRSRSPW